MHSNQIKVDCFKGVNDCFLWGISHCSLRSPNGVCVIGWAENGPGAVLCPLVLPVKLSREKTLGFLLLWYAHEYIDELRADWLVFNE